MITKIILRNFKKFKEEILELNPHIVLAGQNNSGKTTVIQAIAAWHFALQEWLESGRNERSVGIARKEFSPVPLREFKHLWFATSTGLRKGEVQGKNQGAPRSLEIEIHANSEGAEWELKMEFNYTNKDQIYVRPSVKLDEIPEGAKGLDVAYIPSFSGIQTDEHEVTRKYQDTLIGQGKPGDILRNLLQEVAKKQRDWDDLSDHIQKIFTCELLAPSSQGEKSFIECEYRRTGGGQRPSLDINTAGSGFQQVLMLLAFLYARPASVLLIDEPDAHLHINLQGEILQLLRNVSKQRGGQLIIATHSEVLIDSTDPKVVVSFFGKHPHRLADSHDRDKMQGAMKLLRATDLLKCEQLEKSHNAVLCLEGLGDRDILRAWAQTLGHDLYEWLSDTDSYCYDMQGKRPQDAKEHFYALQAVVPNIKCFVLIDSDNKPDKTHGLDPNMRNIALGQWRRYEIENYLVHPDAICRLMRQKCKGGLFGPYAEKARTKLIGILPPDYFKDPLNDPSGYLKSAKGSREILPPVFDAAGIPRIEKSDYIDLAQAMKPEEIHPDVREMLDAIARHFGIVA